MEIKLQEQKLRRFCENILSKVGLSQENAFIVTDSLLFANLRGIDSHGIMRFPFYVERLREGGTKTKPRIKKIKEKAASVLLDGDNGMGQVVGMYATKLAIKKAKKAGVCLVGVRGSSHYGVASYYAVKTAEANMIGFSISNSTPVMAAWGGAKRVIGNNPLSIAVPYQAGRPVVLDISMSRVAGGKVRLAAKNNQKIPKGWIIDRYGRNTENPNDFPEGGALLPFGEHKGYGLAIMMEILSGVLTGAGMLGQIPLWFKEIRSPLDVGHCFGAIDIESFMDLKDFKERLNWVIQEVKSSPLAEGSKGVFVPGEIESKIEEERRKKGIPISEGVWQDLKKMSEVYKEPLEI
ncbi:Ldh family oxidoreductase [Candidatus Aerophobetes bacterium]|uniref:Ldh family oxidoreductase n=1 Tax=Aerophobetes bacterium TaxID=2030807 RepID=A0A523TI19_UNCAE|nr:MAG: Ldh family oxidoreductase [Candidatus Aerophobetes bacterium]